MLRDTASLRRVIARQERELNRRANVISVQADLIERQRRLLVDKNRALDECRHKLHLHRPLL